MVWKINSIKVWRGHSYTRYGIGRKWHIGYPALIMDEPFEKARLHRMSLSMAGHKYQTYLGSLSCSSLNVPGTEQVADHDIYQVPNKRGSNKYGWTRRLLWSGEKHVWASSMARRLCWYYIKLCADFAIQVLPCKPARIGNQRTHVTRRQIWA